MARDDRYIGQTYGPAGMGMNAYMDRPGPQRRPNVRNLGQTYGPAGMGMNAYMNRPEQQQRGIPPSKRFGQGIPSPGRRFERRMGRPAPMPMPMPMPTPTPMDPFTPPQGMNPFSPERFPPMMPRERQGIEQFMPYEDAAVDPSDYRTILKMIEAGLNPDDYMAANRGGIASLMR